MSRLVVSATVAGCLCLGSFAALADSHGMSSMQLAEEKQCMACHTTSNEMPSAPSFPSLAQKYTMDERDRLITVVTTTGSKDHWGSAEMPDMAGRAKVSRQEAEELVDWILEMRDEKM